MQQAALLGDHRMNTARSTAQTTDKARDISPDRLPERQFGIAESYYYGKGVPRDMARAYNWYRKSAEQGFADAQFALGVMYENGRGIDKNESKASVWYHRAAAQGHDGALNNLGCLFHDGRGVAADPVMAAAYFLSAAEAGFPSGQYNASVIYFFGDGVEKNYGKAFSWCSKAAEKGHGPACLRLSYMLEHGIGAEKDGGLAREWFLRAETAMKRCGNAGTACANGGWNASAAAQRDDGDEQVRRAHWKRQFPQRRNVEVKEGILFNDYCPDCLLCCGPQPAGDEVFPMKLLDRQICGREEDCFYMQDRHTAILDHRGCKALGEKGCRLERTARPMACNIFPFVVINRRLYLYNPCPLSVLLPQSEVYSLAEEVRHWLSVYSESDIRRISLYRDPRTLMEKYADLNMPVQGRPS